MRVAEAGMRDAALHAEARFIPAEVRATQQPAPVASHPTDGALRTREAFDAFDAMHDEEGVQRAAPAQCAPRDGRLVLCLNGVTYC